MKKTKKASAKSHTTKAKDLDVKPAKGGAVRGGVVAPYKELKLKID